MFQYLFVIEITDKEYEVRAFTEEQARILAQARAIEDARDHKDIKSVKRLGRA